MFKTIPHFIFYEVKCVWFYINVFDPLGLGFLCRVIDKDLFEFFLTETPETSALFFEDDSPFACFLLLYQNSVAHWCMHFYLGFNLTKLSTCGSCFFNSVIMLKIRDGVPLEVLF